MVVYMMSEGVLEHLSPLEGDVLGVLLSGGKLKVREVHETLKQKVPLTSIAVMLDRLYEKKLVDRGMETCRGGTRYIYYLKKTPNEIEEDYLKQNVDSLINKFGDKAVTYFHKRFSEGRK